MSNCLLESPALAQGAEASPGTRSATFTVFSGELDKLLMAFTLANGAASTGMRTTMFFAFWSLAALRVPSASRGKSLIDRVFGWLLPRGPNALPLSRLNMGGLGAPMVRWRMRRKQVASLTQQIDAARALGVQFVVCETSMDLLGLRREDFLPGVEFGGVAQCLAAASQSELAMVL